MTITSIEGMISVTGEASLDKRIKKYDYITFIDLNGQEVLVKDLRVHQEVDRLVFVGNEGAFVISRVFFTRSLLGAKIGAREAIDPNLRRPLILTYFLLVFVLLPASIVLSYIIIGIPILFVLVWSSIRLPFWKMEAYSKMRKLGFKMKRGVTI